jgi:hypothetical protein
MKEEFVNAVKQVMEEVVGAMNEEVTDVVNE